MSLTLEQAQKYLIIKEEALSKECRIHSSIYNEILSEYTKAVSIRDMKKDERDKKWSELFIRFKSDTTKKITDTEAKSLCDTSPEYTKVTADYYTAKEIADQWENLRNSFGQRGSMLKVMANLYIANLYNNIDITPKSSTAKTALYETMKEEMAHERLSRSEV